MLDEIQRVPELFATLRGVIDESRRHGPANGRFLLSGSASITFLKQSSESLAGRIAYVELKPPDGLETPAADLTRLCARRTSTQVPASLRPGQLAVARGTHPHLHREGPASVRLKDPRAILFRTIDSRSRVPGTFKAPEGPAQRIEGRHADGDLRLGSRSRRGDAPPQRLPPARRAHPAPRSRGGNARSSTAADSPAKTPSAASPPPGPETVGCSHPSPPSARHSTQPLHRAVPPTSLPNFELA